MDERRLRKEGHEVSALGLAVTSILETKRRRHREDRGTAQIEPSVDQLASRLAAAGGEAGDERYPDVSTVDRWSRAQGSV